MKLEEFKNGFSEPLECPHCGCEYLHHVKIEVFNRQEDEIKGLHVCVDRAGLTMDTELLGNPSPRRDGLRIHFSCEQCHSHPQLEIFQPKGCTFVNFKDVYPEKP